MSAELNFPRRAERLAQVLGVVSGVAGLTAAVVTALALSSLATHHLRLGVVQVMGVMLLRWATSASGNLVRQGSIREQRRWWFWRYHSTWTHAGSSVAPERVTEAIDVLGEAAYLTFLRTTMALSLVGLVIIERTAGWSAVAIVIALGALGAPLYAKAGRAAAAMDQEYQVRRRRLIERQLEHLRSGLSLRGVGATSFHVSEIGALSDAEHDVVQRALRVALRSALVTEFLSGVSVGLVAMVVGFGLMNRTENLRPALVGVFVTAEIFLHVRRYGVQFHRQEAVAAAREMLSPWLSDAVLPSRDELRLVNFVTRANPVAVNGHAQAGDRIELRGPSGCGKTTLLETLLGWQSPISGSSSLPTGPIGYVSVDTPMGPGTLRQALGGGDSGTLEVTLAQLGLDSDRFSDLAQSLSHDGVGLSDGERVRSLIARALVHQCHLLILDDVAGVLDEGTQHQVRQLLAQRRDLTVIEATVDAARLIEPTQSWTLA